VEKVFLGRDWTTRSEYSEAIASKIDAQVRMIVEDCYTVAKRLMRENRTVMDRLVDLLIEKKRLTAKNSARLLLSTLMYQISRSMCRLCKIGVEKP
jgi:cell division protease FtsH